MLAKLTQRRALLTKADAARTRHLLVILQSDALDGVPNADVLEAALARRRKKLGDLRKSPVTTDLAHGALVSWMIDDPARSVFERQTLIRKALQPLLSEHPHEIDIALFSEKGTHTFSAAEIAVYAAWVNGVVLPDRKQKKESESLAAIRLHGHEDRSGYAHARARAEGNVLCRELTVLAPNELTPGTYRKRVRALAKQSGWSVEEFDMKRLRKMGAGAFVAVAQGSDVDDAAIVHL